MHSSLLIGLLCVASTTLHGQAMLHTDSVLVEHVTFHGPLRSTIARIAASSQQSPTYRLERAYASGKARALLKVYVRDSLVAPSSTRTPRVVYTLATTLIEFRSAEEAIVTILERGPKSAECPERQYRVGLLKRSGEWRTNIIEPRRLGKCAPQM